MPLEIDQQVRCSALRREPAGDGDPECGHQDVRDVGVCEGRHGGEHRLGLGDGQSYGPARTRPDRRITMRVRNQFAAGSDGFDPVVEFPQPGGPLRVRRDQVGVLAQRRTDGIQRGGFAGLRRDPRHRQVLEQHPPRHPVDDEVVGDQQQPAEDVLARVEPDGLDHGAGLGGQAVRSGGRLGLDDRTQPGVVESGDVDAAQRRRDGPALGDVQRPHPGRCRVSRWRSPS